MTPSATGSSIGTAGENILTIAETITANGGTCGVFITEREGGKVAATAAGAGPISLTSSTGTLTISGPTSTGTGSITLTAEDMAINAPVTSTGALIVQPLTPNKSIGLAGGAGGFNLSSAEIANLMDGFSSITIGRVADGTGVVMVGGSTTFTDPVTLVGGSIDSNGTLASIGHPVTLTAHAGDITDGNGGTVNIVAGSLTASAVTGIDLDTAIDTLNSATVSGTGAIDLADTGALTVINASTVNGNVAIRNTTGDMVIGTVTAGSGAVKLNTEGALLDGNGIANNVTASADSTFTALAVIGMAADPIEVNINLAHWVSPRRINSAVSR